MGCVWVTWDGCESVLEKVRGCHITFIAPAIEKLGMSPILSFKEKPSHLADVSFFFSTFHFILPMGSQASAQLGNQEYQENII